MSIRYSEGLTWNLGDNFVSSFWGSRFGECRNPYRTDILMNVVVHSTGRDLPEDVMVVHNQRKAFGDYLQQRRFLLELVDFADSFGANVGRLHDGIGEADSLRDEAKGWYLQQRYDEARGVMDTAFDLVADLNVQAIRSKDTALFWVFSTEWMAVTGTSIIVGYILHSLMIRRRLYSQSGSTSFRKD
jgi:hypothetical protein